MVFSKSASKRDREYHGAKGSFVKLMSKNSISGSGSTTLIQPLSQVMRVDKRREKRPELRSSQRPS
jgi:hypothetical protein